MAKQKTPINNSSKTLCVVSAIVFAVSTLFFAALYVKEKQNAINVNLGTFGYLFSASGTLDKRTDAHVTGLDNFLTEAAKKDIEAGCASSYYNVTAVNKDETQVLLEYGCDYPSARMFAVYKDNSWNFISPTNQFSNLGIPSCSYVNEHAISSEVAPVCVNMNEGGDPTYQTR